MSLKYSVLIFIAVSAVVCLFGARVIAENVVPPAGLVAEGEKRWDDAVKIYKASIEKEPARGDLWIRIAQIEGSLGHRDKATEALEKAAGLAPGNASLQFNLAQSYSMAERPAKALEAVERALAVDPKNLEYLRARAVYANWIGKVDIAKDSYRRIVALSPGDENAILNLAKAETRGVGLDSSARLFEKYVKQYPENKEFLMEYIKIQSWRGNFVKAINGLEQYKQRFGATIDYRKQKARVLASADRPAAAMELIEPLLQELPNDYEVLFSKTVALHNARQHRDVPPTLDTMESLRPDSVETSELRRFAMVGLRNSLEGRAQYYTESDSIKIMSYHVEAGFQLNPEIRLIGGEDYYDLRADTGSGLESANGRDPITCRKIWAGIDYLVVPKLDLLVRAGGTDADSIGADSDGLSIYSLKANYRASDNISFILANERDLYAVSPRAVSLETFKGSSSLRMLWTPDLNYTFNISGSYDTYSDTNRGWEVVLAPKRSVIRSQRLNLDLGLYMRWLGFDEQLNNGYYSPAEYQIYAVKADGYWKISRKAGMSLVFMAGEQKDNIIKKFEFGTGGDIEGQFRFLDEWLLKVHFGYTHNVSTLIGNYDARVYGISLEKRF